MLSKAQAVATAATAAFSGGILPGWKTVSLACVLPTCLGFFKREYGVSYAYGIATSLTAALVLRSTTATGGIAAWHAGALVFYGIRLNLFLLYREVFVSASKAAVKRIEDKAVTKEKESKQNRFFGRVPFILSCSFLYYGLCAPLFITAQLGAAKPLASWAPKVLQGLVSVTWFGFILAALGDIQKSTIKAIKGEDHLVTGGIYKFFRHPNYTGEIIGWTASCLAGLVAAAMEDGVVKNFKLASYVLASFFGTAGINFVLSAATNSLENKQKEKYGKLGKYDDWVKNSWSGIKLEKKAQIDSHEEPQLEVSDVDEELGSGI